MRIIGYLLQKEFLQIFRNRAMLPILFVMPFLQLLVLAHAATFEVRNTRVHVIDEDGGPTAQRLVDRLTASGYFDVVARSGADALGNDALLRREAGLVVHIPPDFEARLTRTGRAPVQLVLNAEDAYGAGVVRSYALAIVNQVSRETMAERAMGSGRTGRPGGLDVRPRAGYKTEMDYKAYMVPGILVLLVTLIGALLSSMNIAREKEIGTIEQLNVTPIKKYQFIIGKLLPFWIIALAELAFGLLLAKLLFDIPMRGSLLLVFIAGAVYLLVVLGLGLWVSTVTDTQQQSMLISWFILVVFILMSGLLTPIASMPDWGRALTRINPIAYFIEIMRAVLVKGAGWGDIQASVGILAAYAAAVLSLAVFQYRKVTA
jgi:ABC-2 type transport system permease protein